MENGAWKCRQCQHAHGLRGLVSFIVPVLSLLIAAMALLPSTWALINLPRGKLSISGQLVANSVLQLHMLNMGTANVKILPRFDCKSGPNIERNEITVLELSAEIDQPVIIPPFDTKIVRFRFGEFSEIESKVSLSGTAQHERVVAKLASSDTFGALECSMIASDDVGLVINDRAHILEFSVNTSNQNLAGSFYEADVGP